MVLYKIKKIFGPTIEGEGHLTGTAVFFIRFAGCNMWDGKAETQKDSKCPYCDTNFIDGKEMTYGQIISELMVLKKDYPDVNWVVLSGGEPALQMTDEFVKGLKDLGFKISVESNGTVFNLALKECDYVTFSPKESAIAIADYKALKLLFPHPNKNLHPDNWNYLKGLADLYLQPVWDRDYKKNLQTCIEYIYRHPHWRLSLQTHKIIGVE